MFAPTATPKLSYALKARKAISCLSIFFIFGMLIFGIRLHGFADPTDPPTLPNVLILYADDLGYGDLTSYGSRLIQTPNMDRLAEQGLRFTQGYATHATCSPSRYSLLTGEYAWRKKINILPGNAAQVISNDTYTLARLFRDAGYATGVVGKWHLGVGPGANTDWNGLVTPGPNQIGFDYSFLIPATGDRVPCVYLENGRVVGLDPADPITVRYDKPIPGSKYPVGFQQPAAKTFVDSDRQHSGTVIHGIGRIGFMDGGESALWKDEDMGDELVTRAKAFIESANGKPFFLFFATHDPHDPHVPHSRFRGKSGAGARGDAIVQLDANVGALLDFLEARGLTRNTLVILTSDNGPIFADGYFDDDLDYIDKHPAAGILRGGKYSIMEGGTRVPLLVSWPARIQPGVSDAVISQIDFLAGFAALVGKALPALAGPDSRNHLSALLGEERVGNPEIMLCDVDGKLALRKDGWKYFAEGRDTRMRKPQAKGAVVMEEALYQVAEDPAERVNRIATEPARARDLRERLRKWTAGTPAP